MSCGRPKCRPRVRASAATSLYLARRRARLAARRRGRQPDDRRSCPRRSTCQVSASRSPETSTSPSPGTALTTATPRRPETGSALNATPAARARTIRCTSTAGGRRLGVEPVLAPIRDDAVAEAGAPHARITLLGRRPGATDRKLSSWPANECVAPSSSLGRRPHGDRLAVRAERPHAKRRRTAPARPHRVRRSLDVRVVARSRAARTTPGPGRPARSRGANQRPRLAAGRPRPSAAPSRRGQDVSHHCHAERPAAGSRRAATRPAPAGRRRGPGTSRASRRRTSPRSPSRRRRTAAARSGRQPRCRRAPRRQQEHGGRRPPSPIAAAAFEAAKRGHGDGAPARRRTAPSRTPERAVGLDAVLLVFAAPGSCGRSRRRSR